MVAAICPKYIPTFSNCILISGRKTTFYYACIQTVPNTVLNFGIVV